MRITMHAEYDEAVWRDSISSIESLIAAGQATSIHDGRNEVNKIKINGTELVVKYFRNKGLANKINYKIRSSKAQRSFTHAQKIIEAGFKSPQPVAWREDWRGAWLQQSFYISVYHEVAYTVWDLKDNLVPRNDHWIGCLGQLIGKMHNAGVHHLDLTPGNILFVTQDDSFDMYVIDCNRMNFGSIGKDQGLRALVSMGLEGKHIDIYAEAYAAIRNLDIEWCRKRYRQLLKRHKFKWAIKNKTRPWRRKIGF